MRAGQGISNGKSRGAKAEGQEIMISIGNRRAEALPQIMEVG